MVRFPPDLEAYVEQTLASGQFRSRDELVVEAVRLFHELDTKRQRLKSDVQAAIDEADRGLCEPFDIDALIAELNAEFDAKGIPK